MFRTELLPLVSDPDFWCKAGLRLKVLFAVDSGVPRKEVVEVLYVSLAAIKLG